MILTKNTSVSDRPNFYYKTTYVEKCPSTELPIIIYWPNPYLLKYWVRTLVVEEGSNIILRCVFDEHKVVGNKLWYKGNETINFNERVRLKLDNIISIDNVNLNDTNVYRCVSPANEFSTNLVVVKNFKQKPKKIMRRA